MTDNPDNTPGDVPAGTLVAGNTGIPVRDRRRIAIPLIGGATLLLLVSFFFMEPVIERTIQGPRHPPIIAPTWSLTLQHRLLEALTCTWFFLLGASLGSFVHCLEYRWPRGISVVARGSACPGCGRSIRLWHNVPVFGWLWLRGRCARCGWEIPARYALTELMLGSMFVLLLAAELIGGGLNLPLPFASRALGVTENVWDPNWRLIGIFAWHASLLTALVTLCLLAIDRFAIPLRFTLATLAVGMSCPLLWPALQVVRWDDVSSVDDSRFRIAVGLLIGGSSGLLMGYSLVRRSPGNIRAGDAGTTLLSMLLVGLYFGWQAALAIAALAVMLRVLLCQTPARRWPVAVSITISVLVHLLAWRWLIGLPVYPLFHQRIVATLTIVAVPVLSALVDSIEHGGDAGPVIYEPPATVESAPTPTLKNDCVA